MSSSTTPNSIINYSFIDPAEHIKVGSFYEIDHSKLPLRFPHQLSSIRLVMVNEKTRMRVSLRYPSVYSLRTYFNESSYDLNTIANYNTSATSTKPAVDAKKLPALDEKYTIGCEVAGDALYRRVPPDEVSDKRHSWRFWATVPVFSSSGATAPQEPCRPFDVVSRKGGGGHSLPPPPPQLLGELSGPGMVRWGKRRVVQFLARQEEESHEVGDEESSEEEEEKLEEEEEEDIVKRVEKPRALKRVHGEIGAVRTSPRFQERKRPKTEVRNKDKSKNKMVVYKSGSQKDSKKTGKNRAVKNCIDRWSIDRYKLAEVNILKVMKEKGASIRNPILRPALRAAARKLIGDTGLLDHLLKHMAGKVAPGGEERFRRRHNADGAMEYWLERADLVDLRMEAGVQDPYWIPPPGWKPGDNPFQDPVVAGEINEVKEVAAELKKEMKETKEEIAQLKKDMEVLASKKHEEDLVIVATPISSVASQTMEQDVMLISIKEMYIDLVNKKTKIEGQLTELSQSLSAMEEEVVRSKSEKPSLFTSSQELTPPTVTEAEGIHRIRREKEQSNPGGWMREKHTRSQATPGDKASKIERLKSGFRICKPQGTFLWPDKALSSPQYAISPSSAIAHAQNNSKNQSVTSTTTTTVTTSSTTRTTLFNLNDPPENQNDNLILGFQIQSPGHGSSFPRTYHRRHQQSLASPSMIPPGVQEVRHWRASEQEKRMLINYGRGQERGCSSSSPLTASSNLPRGSSSWLALATSKQSQDSYKRG